MQQTVICAECGAPFVVINPIHLRRKHGLTIADYLERHPVAKLTSAEHLAARGKAIAKALANPHVKRLSSQTKRAIYKDPIKGAKLRAALYRGRTDPAIREKAASKMRAKAAEPGYSEFMGKISREGWMKLTPMKRARLIKNMRRAQADPQRRKRQSDIMKRVWVQRNAILRGQSQAKPAQRGRHSEAEETKTYFRIGTRVEQVIPEKLKQDKFAIISARRHVAQETKFQFDVVAQYHKRYRRYCAELSTTIRA